MSISAHSPYEAPEPSTTTRWVAIFVLLSLLAHAIIIAVIMLITVFMPVPKLVVPVPATTTVTLAPMPPAPAIQQKPIFIPTTPQANAPHKVQPVESANDTELQSKSKTARKPDSIMPDVTGKPHSPNLNNTPNVRAPEKPEVSSTPPSPKQAKPEKPTPPQPNPQQGRQTPSLTKTKPFSPTPPKNTSPPVDPLTGLPLLPMINAPTLAPPDQTSQPLTPAPSQQQTAASVHGALGRQGDNSAAAMATALGKYKQKVYLAVGSRWYPKVDNSFQLLGAGTVHIQFTIHSDGTVDTNVLDGGNSSMQMLLSISVNSIREAAPYDPFPPEMVKELISQQGGDGSSYTDDFTFSVY
jgi:outer membrane biosynthesis protein TonB